MRDAASWILAFSGTLLQAHVFPTVKDSMPEILEWTEGIESVVGAISSVVGLGFLWMAYKLKRLSAKEKELDIQKKERELAEDKTASIVDKVLRELKKSD